MSSEYSFSVPRVQFMSQSTVYVLKVQFLYPGNFLCPRVLKVQFMSLEYSLYKFMSKKYSTVYVSEYSLCPQSKVYVLRVQFMSIEYS